MIEPAYVKTGFTFVYTGVMGSGSYHYAVAQMAFFIDVKRVTGEVVRLWQSRQGANYSWDDAFGPPTAKLYIPYGNIQYASDGAGVFDAKQACR
jgi:hypothetical protein